MRYILLILFTMLSLSLYGEEIVKVKGIKFRGLKNIDKYDIMRNVRTAVKGGSIYLDIESLKNKLENNVLINNFILKKENNGIVIDIDENYPIVNVILTGRSESVSCLVDSKFNIIKRAVFFKTDMPIIVLKNNESMEKDKIPGLKGIFKIIFDLKKTGTELFNEISQLEVTEDNEILVSLKKRRTVFLIKGSPRGFMKLEGTLRVLDTKEIYPGFLDLTEELVLIK